MSNEPDTTKQETPKTAPKAKGRQARGGSIKRSQQKKNKFERPQQEFDQKVLDIRRVTRVMAGGRRFSFSVTMAVGDRKGRVGVGLGKAADTAQAIGKAAKQARKNLYTVSRTEEDSLPYQVSAKYCGSEISLLPNKGRGLVAGGAVREVLDLAGVKNVSAKIQTRSKNMLNNARATMEALKKVKRIKTLQENVAAREKEIAATGGTEE